MSTHFRTCPLCEAMCGLRIEVEGERITSIRGDEDDPLSRGFLCPKGPALRGLHEDPDRLRHPLKRVGERFVRIGWDEALGLAADGIHRAQRAHGNDAVAIYLGNPTVHGLGASLFAPRLVRALRTKNRFSATSVDQLPHMLAAHLMLGHQFLLPIPDVDRTEHMMILGANPLASNGSLMSAPNMRGRLSAIQRRGGRVVVIDPRRTETAKVADEHVFVRPGTDAWLLAAIAIVALARGRGLGRLGPHAEGLERLARALEGFGPERAIAGLEHFVAIDFYVNETTRHAHVILPPPSPLERAHYDVAFHHLAVRNTAKLSLPLFEPGPGAMPEHEIMLGLVERLERARGRFTAKRRIEHALLSRVGPVGLVDLGLRIGPRGARAWPPRRGLSAAALLAAPHGVDLGPLEPRLPARLRRWREQIDLAPALFVGDLARLASSHGTVSVGGAVSMGGAVSIDGRVSMDGVAADTLSLIGRRHLRSNNSWMHNVEKLMAGKEMCTLMMHPEDAAARGIADGARVAVSSRVGRIEIVAELTDDVRVGVVSMPHGFGHDREGVQLSVARAHAGASLNDLTDERVIDEASGNAVLSGIEVTVAPAG